jgi:hypothetical protein
VGELRGGYVPGDLSPDEAEQADQLLYEHIMGPDNPSTGQDTPPAGDQTRKPAAGKPGD